mmetsp:Transcript_48428/g.134238  ORF Transcript_48428/g.134238 Transcript_48428/m.134238 type:complete len:215 (+) Transcript_48428:97-741(+)
MESRLMLEPQQNGLWLCKCEWPEVGPTAAPTCHHCPHGAVFCHCVSSPSDARSEPLPRLGSGDDGKVGARLPNLVALLLVHPPVEHPLALREVVRHDDLVHNLQVVRPPHARARLLGALPVHPLVVAEGLEAPAGLQVVGALAPRARLGLPGARHGVLAPHDARLGARRHVDRIEGERAPANAAPPQRRLADHLERVLVEALLVERRAEGAQAV